MEEEGATQLMLREFRKGADDELKTFLLEQGLIEVDLPDGMLGHRPRLDRTTKTISKGLAASTANVRKEILPFADQFRIVTEKPATAREVRECYELYHNVFDQAYEMNVHQLPFAYFENICSHPDYDIIRLYLADDPRPKSEQKPVAVMFSHCKNDNYHALIVGLDYTFVRTHNTYKQILYRTVWRAKELGCTHLDLAFTAELKRKRSAPAPIPCASICNPWITLTRL
ncbi:MAG: GNAT family N-acetyltransferase [Saprospirales bacterium]|nr:GNAT family N-acetyltransferase [Saprospirales bacterium]